MEGDWILDVLLDLRRFAGDNGMPALAEQLDDTLLVAGAELRAVKAQAGQTGEDEGRPRIHHHWVRTRDLP